MVAAKPVISLEVATGHYLIIYRPVNGELLEPLQLVQEASSYLEGILIAFFSLEFITTASPCIT